VSAAAGEVRPGYLLSHRATLLACSGLMLGVLVATMNATIVATALPAVVADLGGLDQYSWVFTGYVLASTVTIPVWGRLSDVHGRRPFVVAGLVLFMLGGVAGALSQSMAHVVLARIVQGVGSGAVLTLAHAGVADLVPAAERGRWQGLMAAVIGGGSVLGPLVGGWIVDHADWRWVFLASIPICLAALVLVLATLRIPPHPERSRSIDWLGTALLTTGVTAVLLVIVELGRPEGPRPAGVVAFLAAGALMLALLTRHERRVPDPILPLELLREASFRPVGLASFCLGVTLFGSIMFVPLLAQGVLELSASRSGLLLMPLMLALTVASAGSGAAIARSGRYRWALLSGPPTLVTGFLLFLAVRPGTPQGLAALAAVVVGTGVGLLFQTLVLVLQNEVHSRHLGLATSTVQMARNLGSAVGVSIFGAIIGAGLPPDVAEAATAPPGVLADAMMPIFLCGIGAAAVAFAAVLRIPETPLRRAVRDDVAAAAQP
jgi:EmrB/QacA subfamily drug resistance transporter